MPRWSKLIEHLIKAAIDWRFRVPAPGIVLVRGGTLLIAAAITGGLVARIRWRSPDSALDLQLDTSGGVAQLLVYAAFALGFAMVVAGVTMYARHFMASERRAARGRVIALELRGLRDTADTPLKDSIPANVEGERVEELVDIRRRYSDGQVTEPDAALVDIADIPRRITRAAEGRNRADVSLVYGGLVSVPFAFLAGMLVDDEANVVALDWDRGAGRWRPLDDDDDGDRFTAEGLDAVPVDARELVLAVSVSYAADERAIAHTFAGLPVVHLRLPHGGPACHWSGAKQDRLALEFLEAVIALSNRGIGRLHLVIAAQSSVAFRLGRAYDKRNLPPAVVYQYERTAVPPYPWGVLLPTHGRARPEIVRQTAGATPA